MSIIQGDVYEASYTAPAAADVVLTVTAPDGTTTTPTVDTGAAPIYRASVPATLVGAHLLTWVASGAVTDVFTDQFTVTPPALQLISFSELREQVNISPTDSTTTSRLRRYIQSATDVVQNITGPILPTTKITYFDGGQSSVTLPVRWVKSITSVVEWWGGTTTFTLTVQTPGSSMGSYNYMWDQATNALTRLAGGFPTNFFPLENSVTVTYVAGMATIPQDITDATGELIRHWWQNGQQPRSVSFTNPGGDDDTGTITVMTYAVPNRVVEMLAPYTRRPAIF